MKFMSLSLQRFFAFKNNHSLWYLIGNFSFQFGWMNLICIKKMNSEWLVTIFFMHEIVCAISDRKNRAHTNRLKNKRRTIFWRIRIFIITFKLIFNNAHLQSLIIKMFCTFFHFLSFYQIIDQQKQRLFWQLGWTFDFKGKYYLPFIWIIRIIHSITWFKCATIHMRLYTRAKPNGGM